MSYKNDSLLVIANKYGKADGDAKAELFETYDQIRDLTVGGPGLGGATLSGIPNFFMHLAQLVSPSSFMPIMGAGHYMNVPGTSYSSPVSGGNSITSGGQAAFGFGNMGNYTGLSTGGAASNNNMIGNITGGAASLVDGGAMSAADIVGTTAGAGVGTSAILPAAGVIAGLGSIAAGIAPYFGPFGVIAGMAGNMASGYAGAVLSSYQGVTGRVINNADSILAARVKNIETVTKELDAQNEVIKKMLKESIDGDSKLIQALL